MGFRYLEHTADVMFCVEERTVEALFVTAAKACFDVLADPVTIKSTVMHPVEVSATSVADLFYNFLEEIVFLKDAEGLVFCRVDALRIDGKYTLSCVLRGDVIDSTKQTLRHDVKAVTLHQFLVEKRKTGWYAQVILDV